MTPANGAESSDPVLAETVLAETVLAETVLAETAITETARAETYLRLVTETELRRALAFPRVRSPEARRPPAAVLWASRAAGAVLAGADLAARPLQSTARRAGPAVRPWAAGAARFLAPPTRQARRAVSQVAWQASSAGRRLRRRLPDRHHTPPAEDGLSRVRAAADLLMAVRALDESVAESVVSGLYTALALRERLGWHPMPRYLRAFWGRRGRPAPAPAGPVTAVSVGTTVRIEADGESADMYLVALVLGPDTAALTTVAWPTRTPARVRGKREPRRTSLDEVIDQVEGRAADDLGGSYLVRADGGGGSLDGPGEGEFRIEPVPPTGLRWLEISMSPGQPPVRIELPARTAITDSAPIAGSAPAAGQQRAPASPADRAERIIDAVAQNLLPTGQDGWSEAVPDLAEVTSMVRVLREAGVLAPASPALARLGTLARRIGIRIPDELAAAGTQVRSGAATGAKARAGAASAGAEGGDLPAAWQAVLEQRDRADGRVGLVPVAAVLPGLDGARCVLAGLRSEAGYASLQVLAWGWPSPRFETFDGWPEFSWRAHDDSGRWHVGQEREGSYGGDGISDFRLALTPPLRSAATTLTVILIGTTGEVAVTVPLNWTAARAGGQQ
jgi:hypothetical protein